MTDHITLPRAVVEQALEALEFFKGTAICDADTKVADEGITALRAPLAEPVQEPVAWQDTTKPTELVSAEEWEYIDPMWHWMYRPLYTSTPDHTAEIERAVAAENEACEKAAYARANEWPGYSGGRAIGEYIVEAIRARRREK